MKTARRYTERWAYKVAAAGMAAWLGAFGACGQRATETAEQVPLADEIVGTWFAYRDNVIENMWTFRRDGTCINDGWPAAGPEGKGPSLPYHLEGTYKVAADQVTVVFAVEGGIRDTVALRDPDITLNRLVYTSGNAPVAFLRERAAVGQEMTGTAQQDTVQAQTQPNIVGSWVALANGFPVNTWKFGEDGTFVNEGWGRMNAQTLIVRRLYQVRGHYTASGTRVILTNENLVQFDPETERINTEVPISERIVLYDVVTSKGRLVYTNEVGLPVAFRPGVVTPTNW